MTTQIGTIIHGTLRNQDLLPAFLDALSECDPAVEAQIVLYHPIPAYAMEDDSSEWWDSEEASELVFTLMDDLNEFAPAYCYFGPLPGDGSDFGFWPDFDALSEINHVSDPSELDTMGGYEAVHVNDHGNVTLYARDSDGAWHIVWDIV